MSDISREKATFAMQHGLFEFHVITFCLTNAPTIFQWLLHHAISTLDLMEGPGFISVYIDNLLVYSRTLHDYFHYLSRVMDRLRDSG